ncbi:unnamed protein product [Linum tenue]|uniref:Uncharacterized protein n=1 Tax=Linum tenue TaxID=586396 RepID=A0AAV0MLE4_9ROSI|nr:unnamed protein product [Linum tenue]
MEELSKANAILLPLESMLSKDVAGMTVAIAREKEANMDVSPIHGQALYQSYYSRIRESIQAFKPIVPSLTTSVKGLRSMLTSLARTASLHAGNLHKVKFMLSLTDFTLVCKTCKFVGHVSLGTKM